MRLYYNEFFDLGQQKIQFSLYQLGLPSGDPVHTLKKVLEELNYESLLAQYSTKGRRGYNPIMIFAVLIYANMRGVRAVDRIVELCQRDLAFIWLTKGGKPGRDVFYDFIKDRLTGQVLEDLHYQFIRRLQKEDLITLEALFIDGTKIEANANRYTFVWRGSINYHLARLLDTIDALYNRFNRFLSDSGYGKKYKIPEAHMFVVEGMERVRKVIEENRKRKLTKHSKLPNNTVIEIDRCSPLELLQMQTALTEAARAEGITFQSGKGKHKSEIQQLHEELEACGERLLTYKNNYETMGSDRNSYSKTDVEATFMRMKDDHMMNGQLKPAYNVQIAVENYFIIHTYISSDRTDYNTLVPVLEKHKAAFCKYPEEATADSGYCSERNLLYLRRHGIRSYIKLQTHEKRKTRAYKEDIGKYYNMMYMVEDDTHYYRCHDGRRLDHIRTEQSRQEGYIRQTEVYGCEDCGGCEHKARCLYRYDGKRDKDKNKVMKINETWVELQADSHANIQSEKGILNRQIRSIQTEGHFGDLKENDGFRRFNYRTEEKVCREFMLYAFGRNINKYHRFLEGEIKKYEGKAEQGLA
ncbi:IS1182 family transposase [Ruminococcus gauvreauii]|uniref:IS1182 family transposase n=1 Tax=Ruminococcus gauvreauii TaxID=438033 RepID=A0ABY5VJ13_9FIRM|nr:IS1182 family transposase [Ruminococcus gauvreauii]UWP60555.1 IS1182 family transposase [Ruminococcus gauvreauii]